MHGLNTPGENCRFQQSRLTVLQQVHPHASVAVGRHPCSAAHAQKQAGVCIGAKRLISGCNDARMCDTAACSQSDRALQSGKVRKPSKWLFYVMSEIQNTVGYWGDGAHCTPS